MNHYVLDIVGSAVLLAASIAIATGWDHLAERRARTVLTSLNRDRQDDHAA